MGNYLTSKIKELSAHENPQNSQKKSSEPLTPPNSPSNSVPELSEEVDIIEQDIKKSEPIISQINSDAKNINEISNVFEETCLKLNLVKLEEVVEVVENISEKIEKTTEVITEVEPPIQNIMESTEKIINEIEKVDKKDISNISQDNQKVESNTDIISEVVTPEDVNCEKLIPGSSSGPTIEITEDNTEISQNEVKANVDKSNEEKNSLNKNKNKKKKNNKNRNN